MGRMTDENESMDLETACKKIFDIISEKTKQTDAPVAYVNVRFGKDWRFSDYETTECFNKIKWDSALSTADLNIIHDDECTDLFRVEDISGFEDV